jgi:SAM-dependent methyltransferase
MTQLSNKLSQVAAYWNEHPCNLKPDAEEIRYRDEPDIHAFAQFSRYRGKRVLEIGVGIGIDYLQWLRSGALASGIDISEVSLEHARDKAESEGLTTLGLFLLNGEGLPYKDNTFDLIYSWGVIHHSEYPEKIISEAIRVTRGECKFMVYNRHSILAYYKYLRYGLFTGKPFKSITKIIRDQQESSGTRAFTKRELLDILGSHRITGLSINAPVQPRDFFAGQSWLIRYPAYVAAFLMGLNNAGWFMTVRFRKG